jgi:hypothetical protein
MPADGFDLANCTISFKVGITGELIDRKANPDIDSRLHEDADNYSLTRLYMDLTSNTLVISSILIHLLTCTFQPRILPTSTQQHPNYHKE